MTDREQNDMVLNKGILNTKSDPSLAKGPRLAKFVDM
jgi:hypothetical protein